MPRNIGKTLIPILAIGLPLFFSCSKKSVEPHDNVAPAAVTSLSISNATRSTVTLAWTAPGDDSLLGTAFKYDLRYSQTAITEGNWKNATSAEGLPKPKSCGQQEHYAVEGLDSNAQYYFAIRTADESANWSGLSNLVTIDLADTIPPARITDFSIIRITPTSLTLSWTAPGDDSILGSASQYDVRYDTTGITEGTWGEAFQADDEPKPKSPGEPEEFEIHSLQPSTAYYFAIKALDDGANISELSNAAFGRTTDNDTILWIRTFGGSGIDEAAAVVGTPDGGIVIAGRTNSYGAGKYDVYLVRTDGSGDLLWEKTFGGADDDYAYDLIMTEDGGFAVSGVTYSFGAGSADAYFVKTDAQGNLICDNTIGGASDDEAFSLDRTADGGFVLCGTTKSFGPVRSAYLVKTDGDGIEQWSMHYYHQSWCFQDPIADAYASSVSSTFDGKLALGFSVWYNEPIGHSGSCIFYGYALIKKVDLTGKELWTRSLFSYTSSVNVVETNDAGFAMLAAHAALAKCDSLGNVEWSTALIGSYNSLKDLCVTSSGKYIAAGDVRKGIPGLGAHYDACVASVDQWGNALTQLVFESDQDGSAASVAQAADGNIIVAGWKGVSGKSRDVYLIKISSDF